MGKSTPSAPAAPDPYATAAAQAASNKETAVAQSLLNQVNEYTPYGQSVYTKRGEPVDGIQQFDRTTTLDPAQQAIVDQQTAISGQLNELAGDQITRVGDSLTNPYSYEGMPDAPVADATARQQTIDAINSQYASRLDPRFADAQTALETQLANQGIGVGSDAYTKAMESQNRSRNDAYQSAMNAAITGGGAEQSRLFGLQGNARERAIQEYERIRNAPLNEVAALMSGTQINNPTFSAIPQTGVSPTDLTGAINTAYQGNVNNYATQVGANNAATGGLFGLAGAVGGGLAGNAGLFKPSDRRIKKNIKKVGKLDNGLDVYSYQYKWGGPQQIGLMAQDVEKVNPKAVQEFNGIKAVNYSEAVL